MLDVPPKKVVAVTISCAPMILFLFSLMFSFNCLFLPCEEYSFLLLAGYKLFVIKKASATFEYCVYVLSLIAKHHVKTQTIT